MKQFEILIDFYQADWILAPIRKKSDIIALLMGTIKIMLVNTPPADQYVGGKIILHISKMSRVFYISASKIFSINFPFKTLHIDGEFNFSSSACSDVNNRMTSEVLEIFENENLLSTYSILEFVDPIFELSATNSEIWGFVRELLLLEDGYLRYDLDPSHEDGHLHPLNHIDVFYSSNLTFKLGLDYKLNQDSLSDILDLNTNCHYVHPCAG